MRGLLLFILVVAVAIAGCSDARRGQEEALRDRRVEVLWKEHTYWMVRVTDTGQCFLNYRDIKRGGLAPAECPREGV